MDGKPKLLIVTHVFPPAGGIAVQRALAFTKYLSRQGFEVHVLTARNPGAPTLDPGLLKQVPPEVVVHHSFTPEPSFAMRQRVWKLLSPSKTAAVSPAAQPQLGSSAGKSLKGRLASWARQMMTPDPEVVWAPFAQSAGKRIIARHGIEMVYLTAPPFSIFLTALELKRRFPHLVVVSDFRDEWLNFYLRTFDFHKSESIRRKAADIERATIRASDVVLTVTDAIRDEIRERYPEEPDRKFVCIPNGYDPEVFAPATRPPRADKLVVAFTGTVYLASSPRPYLDALDKLPEYIRKDFQTRFVGRVADDQKSVFSNRLSEIDLLGFVPQADVVRHLEEASFLLLVMTDASSLTGKIFEYLATGRPILAITPAGGEIARLLEQTGAGWCASPDREADIAAMLERAWRIWRGESSALQPDVGALDRYSRPRQAEHLARLMREASLCSQPPQEVGPGLR